MDKVVKDLLIRIVEDATTTEAMPRYALVSKELIDEIQNIVGDKKEEIVLYNTPTTFPAGIDDEKPNRPEDCIGSIT
jgi:hypothetical protein